MTRLVRLVMAQQQNRVGDIEANVQAILQQCEAAKKNLAADLVVFPELALTGYPPEDLLLRPSFYQRLHQALDKLAAASSQCPFILGYPEQLQGRRFNAASYFAAGQLQATWRKSCLPNYSVFDEKRYFDPAPCAALPVITVGNLRLTCLICEDIWQEEPIARVQASQAQALIILNASPFHHEKPLQRQQLLTARIQEAKLPMMYVHCVGGQDELVFDGGSMVLDQQGKVVIQAPFFQQGLIPVDWKSSNGVAVPIPQKKTVAVPQAEALVYDALVCGVRDYVQRNGFQGALVGASGGIDSALTLAIARDALGEDDVVAVAMPSRYSAAISAQYAAQQANLLGIDYHELPIEQAHQALLNILAPLFAGKPMGVAEENLQARIRGTLLMGLSNKLGKIVLTTGNKSELAVGYATLYGDMAGGYAVLKDVFKTWVYRLARYRNSISEVIPTAVISRPPTAELRSNQLDADSLPPYEILDGILEAYIEQDLGVSEIVALGYERETVLHILHLVDSNEFKRRQAPPGIRVSARAFGLDRRYPITSGYGRARN